MSGDARAIGGYGKIGANSMMKKYSSIFVPKRVYAKFVKKQNVLLEVVGQSFLPDEMKLEYAKLLAERIDRISN